ncbi:MAG TPA: tripartite tricarboxylate transporter TctB family protein [Methylomirabilota bacterium]|jgi:putative tricarboxylic transport membrane protein|nr:tripartite tricarboxylate transporter TctB family protein [Methylomirabilota bacterium]
MGDRLVALVVVAGAALYLTQALALPFGTSARPGAGFFPVVVAVLAGAVGLIAAARAFTTAPVAWAPRAARSESGARRRRVLGATAALVAFCVLLPWLGYPLSAFGFVGALLLLLGSGWRVALATAVLSAAVSHYLFAVLLDVPLPRGPW